ncbi:hypothetical protein UFOVP36_20 [uncultured Caudovirales phage]|uniref:Uncharacterized protein n=1 Tax=uncultured Caudovirales phage TaxID=2100421 RepID=A0A6J5KM84_9CAUD|nr:hypothetical protein UFOVP36_20 [uncultured Caudovirales phage]
MWIFMNDAFLSIVEPSRADLKADLTNEERANDPLLVRARRPADIIRVFKNANVIRKPGRDYAYRAYISRNFVAKIIAEKVACIDYGNFKDTVTEDARHDAYLDVWSTMHAYQSGAYDERRV